MANIAELVLQSAKNSSTTNEKPAGTTSPAGNSANGIAAAVMNYAATGQLPTRTPVVPSPDPLIEAASKPEVTTPDVKPQATPNLNINAFGAGDTSGGAKLMGNVFGAAGTGIAASAVETAGQLTQPQGLTIGENARLAAQGKGTQEEIAKAEKEKADRIRENIQKPLYETSDKLQEKSQQFTENAKEGLDSVGQFIVDAAITGTQLAGDVALGAINPALGTASMATRVFGSSAQEARQAGATETQQQIYGLASAATSILVEKVAQVGNLFKKAYGGSIAGGSVDDILTKVISKLVKNPTAQRVIASAIGEGGEEALEAFIQPALQAIYDKGANLNKTWFTDNSEEAKEYLADVGYNALLGSLLGAVGGGGNATTPAGTGVEANVPTPNASASRVEVEGDTNTPAVQNAAEGVTEAIAANEPITSKDVEEIANANKNLSVSDIEAALPRAKQIYASATEAQNRLNAVLDDVARTLGFSREHDTQKSLGSIVSRIVRDNASGKTGSPIKDAARGHLEMPSWDYTQRVLDALTNAKIPYTATQKQTAQGYRGLHLTWDDGGVGVELQLTTPEVWAVKMKSEEIYAKWREFEANGADPNSVSAEVFDEYNRDIARSLEMWSQLAPVLPDFTMFATSSSDSGVPSISSVKETGDVGLTQEPLTSSSTRTEASPVLFNTRPDSVKMNTKSSPSADIVADGENYVNKTTDAQNSVGAAHPSQLPFSHAETLYGVLPQSDRAVRSDDVPRSVDGKTNVSQSVVSAKGSALTSDGFVPILERGTLEGDYSFARLTNNKAVQNAMKLIKRAGSREGAYSDWLSTVNRKGMNAERAAEAMLLYNDAQYHGEFAKARKIFTEYQRLERDNARALQIARLWHEMTPQNQLDILFEQVENLNEELAAANKQKIGADVPVEEWLTRIGEELATHLEEAGNLPDARVKTVAQTIIGDLKHFYNKDSYDKSSNTKSEGKRTEYDRLRDMLNNFGEYLTAFEATKAKLAEDLKDYPEAVAAFNEWIYDLPNIGKRLARELMGETDIRISDDATAAFLNAKTAAEKDAALDAIAAEVAAQIPTSIKDILTTLRYTNMLFNLKTTNRNLIGNIAMMASSRLKNAISAGMQKVIPSLENTRSVKVKPEYKDIGRAEFEKHKRTIMSQGKYSDATIGSADDFGSRVEELRNKANNTGNKKIDKLLTPLRVSNDATQKLLNNAKFGDEAFLRNHYAFALGGYLQAQGITPEQWNDPQWQADNEELVNKILGFAATEAQENTFRDRNEFSDWVASIGRGNSAMPKYFKPVAEGLFPFRRTTANVAKAGFDYSPAGLIGTAVNVGRKAVGDAEFLNPVLIQIQEVVGKKDVTANDIADQLAKGLTGTGLMLVGYILSKLGFLRGGDDEDKAQAEFDKLVGRQPYSFEIGDHSITLDWLSPTSMPLFMGAALQNLVADEGLSSKTVGEALLKLTDPMIEMSMLSGLKDSLDGVKYADNNLWQFALDASLNWLFQYMYSTAGGQIERTFEENRMMTYVDKNKDTATWLQYARGRNAAKGLGEYGQTEYIDAWGNTQSNGSFLGRALENFISPAYHNKVELNSVEKELQRVYDATGENVLPSLADKKVGDKNLTAEEYTKYATKRGNEMYALMESVIANNKYKSLTDEQKAAVLSGLKVYANAVGAKAAVPEYTPSAQAVAMLNAKKNGVSPEEYMLFTVYRNIVDKPSKNGNYGSYTKEEKQEAAKRAGITGKGADYLINK